MKFEGKNKSREESMLIHFTLITLCCFNFKTLRFLLLKNHLSMFERNEVDYTKKISELGPGNSYQLTILCFSVSTVDGVLRDWGPWDHCSATCKGHRKRTRACIPPTNGGAPCRGSTIETEQCGTQHCPGIKAQFGQHVEVVKEP